MSKFLILAAALLVAGCGDSVPQAKGAPKPELVPGLKAADSDADVAPPTPKKS